MSNASNSNKSFLIPIAIAGIMGQCFLSIYFSGILVPKELIATPNSVTQLSDLVTKHRSAIILDAWLMGIGSFLSVIFYIGLVYVSGAIVRFSGLLTVIASAAVLAVALVDVTFMVAVANAAILGHTDTTNVAFDFVAGGGGGIRLYIYFWSGANTPYFDWNYFAQVAYYSPFFWICSDCCGGNVFHCRVTEHFLFTWQYNNDRF